MKVKDQCNSCANQHACLLAQCSDFIRFSVFDVCPYKPKKSASTLYEKDEIKTPVVKRLEIEPYLLRQMPQSQQN